MALRELGTKQSARWFQLGHNTGWKVFEPGMKEPTWKRHQVSEQGEKSIGGETAEG